MPLSTILLHLSILTQQQDPSSHSSNKNSALEFINLYSSSITTGLADPGQDIELRKRSSKKSPTGQEDNVFHSRISPLSSSRETSHHEHQGDPISNQAATRNPDLWIHHLSSSTATTKLRFERDALFRFHPNLTIFHVGDLGAPTRSHAGSKIAKYHAQMSGFRHNVPDLVLRYANTPKHQVSPNEVYTAVPPAPLGVAYFRWSRSVRMGFRWDTAHHTSSLADELIWEEMRNTSSWWMHNKYEFSIEVPRTLSDLALLPSSLSADDHNYDSDSDYDYGTSDSGRVHFRWQRINSSSDGLTSIWQRVLMMNYKLVQISSDSPATLATFLTDHKSVRNRGTLYLHAKVPRDLEVAIVLSCAALNEKGYRRRCWAYRGLSAGP